MPRVYHGPRAAMGQRALTAIRDDPDAFRDAYQGANRG